MLLWEWIHFVYVFFWTALYDRETKNTAEETGEYSLNTFTIKYSMFASTFERNCAASSLDYIVIQMRKTHREKRYWQITFIFDVNLPIISST